MKKRPDKTFLDTVQLNCDISDARDHGIYSICILVLRLRGLYKWEKGIEPWEEPEASEVLDWIDKREQYWDTLLDRDFLPVDMNGCNHDPFDTESINDHLYKNGLYYGAGYGLSMKPIFFVAEILEERQVGANHVIVLGHEFARELAGPFALRQNDRIIIRREPLKHFLTNHLQDILPSAKEVMTKVFGKYSPGNRSCILPKEAIRQHLDSITNQEIPVFIHHEIGEIQNTPLSGEVLQSIISDFPDSLVEFFCRAVKDILADTHINGMLGFIIKEEREQSLGLYLSFINGIRRILFPEIAGAIEDFLLRGLGDWKTINTIREQGWRKNLKRAEEITELINGSMDNDQLLKEMDERFFKPLQIGQ